MAFIFQIRVKLFPWSGLPSPPLHRRWLFGNTGNTIPHPLSAPLKVYPPLSIFNILCLDNIMCLHHVTLSDYSNFLVYLYGLGYGLLDCNVCSHDNYSLMFLYWLDTAGNSTYIFNSLLCFLHCIDRFVSMLCLLFISLVLLLNLSSICVTVIAILADSTYIITIDLPSLLGNLLSTHHVGLLLILLDYAPLNNRTWNVSTLPPLLFSWYHLYASLYFLDSLVFFNLSCRMVVRPNSLTPLHFGFLLMLILLFFFYNVTPTMVSALIEAAPFHAYLSRSVGLYLWYAFYHSK